jgi:hypothetical protein
MLAFAHQTLQLLNFFGAEGDDVFFHALIFCRSCSTPATGHFRASDTWLVTWRCAIEEGDVHVFDAEQGAFVPASVASHSGTGPYQPYVGHGGQIISDV